MKKNLRTLLVPIAPLALCGFVGAAFADDSSVTLYGVLDESIANISHSLNFDSNYAAANNPGVTKGTHSATGLLNGGLTPDRFGLRGSEDLGGGLHAVFTLESSFNPSTGALSNGPASLAANGSTGPNYSNDSSLAGQLFARGAFVGLTSTSWGSILFGRQQSFFGEYLSTVDPLQGSQAFSALGASSSYVGGGFTEDARTDNAVKYSIPVGDFTFGVLHKFGGQAGSSTAQSSNQLNAVYASGPLTVQLGYEAFKDAFSLSNNAAGSGLVKSTAADTKAWQIAAKYTIAQTTLRAGFESISLSNPSNPAADAAVPAVLGQNILATVSGSSTTYSKVTAYDTTETLKVYWLGGTQNLSTAFSVSAGLYHVKQNDFQGTATGCSATKAQGACTAGSLNFESLVGDYRFSKRTDAYAGVMFDNVSGGPAQKVLNSGTAVSVNTNRIVALGLRHVF